MNSPFSARKSWLLVTLLLAAGLASCSHTPEATTAATAPAAAPASTAAPVAAPAPAVAEAPKVAPTKALPKPKQLKPVVAAQPAPAATPVITEAAPAAPAPEPTVAPAPAAPTTHTQAGRVLDENGRPLAGATVMLRGTTKVTSTDATGNYTLEVPNGENTFSVGYGGYQDETATSRDGQPLNVTLLPSPGSKSKKRR